MNKRTKPATKTSLYASDQVLREFTKLYGLTENIDGMMVLWMAIAAEVRDTARREATNNPDVNSAISHVRKAVLDSCPTTALADEFAAFLAAKRRK